MTISGKPLQSGRMIILALVFVLGAVGCATAGSEGAEKMACDARREVDITSYLALLAEHDSPIVKSALEASMTYWRTDPTYDDVRQGVLNLPEAQTLLRIEFGAEPDRRYGSLWFVATQGEVLEFATGYGIVGVAQRTVPKEQWQGFERSISGAVKSEIKSKANIHGVDLAVYFVCGLLDGQEFSWFLMEYTNQSPAYQLIRRSLELSEFREVPLELRSSKKAGQK